MKNLKRLTTEIPDPTEFELGIWEEVDSLVNLLISKHKDYGPRNIADAPGGAINGLGFVCMTS